MQSMRLWICFSFSSSFCSVLVRSLLCPKSIFLINNELLMSTSINYYYLSDFHPTYGSNKHTIPRVVLNTTHSGNGRTCIQRTVTCVNLAERYIRTSMFSYLYFHHELRLLAHPMVLYYDDVQCCMLPVMRGISSVIR